MVWGGLVLVVVVVVVVVVVGVGVGVVVVGLVVVVVVVVVVVLVVVWLWGLPKGSPLIWPKDVTNEAFLVRSRIKNSPPPLCGVGWFWFSRGSSTSSIG